MKELPILFSTPMVKATDANRKTITRRMRGLEIVNESPDSYVLDYLGPDSKGMQVARLGKIGTNIIPKFIKCPYGSIGDLLWVRETFVDNKKYACSDYYEEVVNEPRFKYKALYPGELIGAIHWSPSIHMPKDAARTWLKITDIRVERLQDITEADAIAEGIEELKPWPEAPHKKRYTWYYNPDKLGYGEAATFDPKFSFYTLWTSINGENSIINNPWVWVVVFEKLNNPGFTTTGGYSIKDFKVFDTPKPRSILDPMLYSGIFHDTAYSNQHEYIEWDVNGKCSNWKRGDCFINPSDIKNWKLNNLS